MTIMQAPASGAATTATFEVRAIDPGVLARLRVADDAGHAPCAGPDSTEFPEYFVGSQRMFRAYRADGSILRGRLASAGEIGDQAAAHRLLDEIFADPEVAVVHARAVEFGCFTFEIRRVST